MWSRRTAVAMIAAVLVAAGVSLSTPASADVAPVAVQPGAPSSFRLGYTDPARAAADAARYRVIVLNADAAAHIPTIRANNPFAVVLMYRDAAFAASWDRVGVTHGVGMDEAALHPTWFLLDSSGNRVESQGWPGNFLMDVASPTYQAAWALNTRAEIERNDWDGIFIDDVNWKADFAGKPSVKYPTNTAWRAATRSFLAAVTPSTRAGGKLAILNIGSGHAVPGLWTDWLAFADGAMEEHFTNWSGTSGGPYLWDWGPDGWIAHLNEVAAATAAGKISLLRVGGVNGDHEAMRYGIASYHLVNDGRQTIAPPRFDDPPTYPELTWDLGTPSGAYRKIAPNVYRRDFSAGAAIVNASEKTPITVGLDRTYLGHDGKPITSITLGPTRGAVLRTSAGEPEPTPVAAAVPTPLAPSAPRSTRAPKARYTLATADGTLTTFATGSAPAQQVLPVRSRDVIGAARTQDGDGAWAVTSTGDVSCSGAAVCAGDVGSHTLASPIVGMAATPSDNGYWLVARDGGIFSFGDAAFHGSTGALRLNQPIVGMASTPSGRGYWLVARDGGIFSFGDAVFHGSTGALRLNQPIVGMESSPSGRGYWLVARDGGIFSFGDAAFHGSTGAMRLNQPIIGMSAEGGGRGYWLVAGDGGIFSFGDAPFAGSLAPSRVAVTAIAR